MGLIKFILYFILILWLLRIIGQLLLPLLFKRIIKKAHEQTFGQQQTQSRPEGSIQIDHVPPKTKARKKDEAGEFVDFEEIK